MKICIEIDSVKAEIRDNVLVISSRNPLKTVSTAPLNGGLKEVNTIINVQVPESCGENKKDQHWNPQDFLRRETSKLKLPVEKTAALMTAAKMENVAVSNQKSAEFALAVFVTAGTTISVTAGEPTASKNQPYEKHGTINIIVLIDGKLTESCLVEVIKTATEAKTVALRELDIGSCFSFDLASGTMTDGIAISCTQKGREIKYAGTNTLLGELVGKAVRESVKSAILKQEGMVPNRTLIRRLRERGILLENLFLLSSESKMIMQNPKKRSQLDGQFQKMLMDKNVSKLVVASLRLDEDTKTGLIPETEACSQLGEDLVEQIVQKASKNYYAEENKREVVEDEKKTECAKANLGPFTRNVLLAILDQACSQIAN
jgi:adenosylcobinamide hydrolase